MAASLGRTNRYIVSYGLVRVKLMLPAAIIGLQGFFPLKGQAAAGVGSIEYPVSERKRLAAL